VTDYRPPLDDIRFCVRHLAGLDETLKLEAFSDFGADDIDQILEEAGRFAQEVIAPTQTPGDRHGCRLEGDVVRVTPEFEAVHNQMVENGWLAVGGAPEYDGMGLPAIIEYATSEMFQSANLSFALMGLLTRDGVHAMQAHASDELKQVYLPKMISGQWSATMNLTEPQAGSDLSVINTRAKRDGDHFRISGTKIFISWGDHEIAENVVHLVLARIDGAPEGVRGISLFLVPKYLPDADGNPGDRNDLRATSLEHKLGLHGSPTCVMSFGDNDGAIGYLVGEENRGLAAMFTMMNQARMDVGLQGVAVSERALQLARTWANQRIQGRIPGEKDRLPISHHADVRRMLMLMRAQTEATRAVAYAAAGATDAAHNGATDEARRAANSRLSLLTPVVKGWCTEVAMEVTSLGVQVHGGMGYVEETGAAQFMRDARVLPIYEGTNGIQAGDFVGRKILADEGREIGLLIAELRELCDALEGDDAMKTLGGDVRIGIGQLEDGVRWLIETGSGSPDATGGASFDLLMLAGVVLGAAYLAKSAAMARADGSGVDAAFADAKLATAQFYCAHVLPRAHAHLAAAVADTATLTGIAAGAI